MSVKLKKIRRPNPLNPALVRWYLVQESAGTVSLPAIARDIEGRSALSLGDVQSALTNLMEVMPVYLKLGQSIKLEGFGTFRLTVSSRSTPTPAELNAHHVKAVKLVFLPSVALKRSLKDISFELIP